MKKYVKHVSGVYGIVKVVTKYQVVISWNDGDRDASSSHKEVEISAIEDFINKWNKDEEDLMIKEVSKEEYLAATVMES